MVRRCCQKQSAATKGNFNQGILSCKEGGGGGTPSTSALLWPLTDCSVINKDTNVQTRTGHKHTHKEDPLHNSSKNSRPGYFESPAAPSAQLVELDPSLHSRRTRHSHIEELSPPCLLSNGQPVRAYVLEVHLMQLLQHVMFKE